MQAAAAQTGVWLSDGSTQVMPTGDERLVWVSLDTSTGDFSYAYAVN